MTRPLAGTFVEFYDLLREAIEVGGWPGVLERLDRHMTMFPEAPAAREELEAAGFEDVEVEVRRFSLLFRSSSRRRPWHATRWDLDSATVE